MRPELLFVYAQLQSKPLKHNASAFGVLRRRGADGVARFNAKYTSKVYGQVSPIKDWDISDLDKLEGEHNEFARVKISLTDGRPAFAYEYMPDDFSSLERIESGKWK